MGTIYDQDSYYFKIITKDGTKIHDLGAKTISLEITEEIGMITRGNISIYDPTNVMAGILPFGQEFDIEWGYKKRGDPETIAKLSIENPADMTSSGFRRGQKCMLVTPSWSYPADGKTIYNGTFYSWEYQQDYRKAKVYQSSTRSAVIREAFADMQVTSVFVRFDTENDSLNSAEYVRQNETNFRFLLRLAYEWHCFFKISYNSAGVLSGIFVENKFLGDQAVQAYVRAIVGGIGSNKLLDRGLKAVAPNVISALVARNVGENGQGSNVTIRIINGQTMVFRSVAGTNTVQVQRLDEQRLKTFIEENQDKAVQISKQVRAAENLQDEVLCKKIETFFDDVTASTAPEGLGWSIKCQMLGDPTLTPPLEVIFGKGFPADIQEQKGQINKYYVKSVTHKLDQYGYKCSLDCGDSITVFGGFVTTKG